ncbi:MAG: class I SAM-dependent methyltransferase [Halobacteriota archaeon]
MVRSFVTDAVIKPRIAEHSDDLESRLSQIGKMFDISRLIDEPRTTPQLIKRYARTRLSVVFQGGFCHYGISYDGKFNKRDLTEQARIVERHIHASNAKNVLELAYGFGSNIAFLAKRNPAVSFDGIDLSLNPLKRYAKIPNASFQIGDFHDLSAFEDNAYDIVFVIDALSHSTDKLQVLREVKKKLKKGGLFIIIDEYRTDRATPLSSSEEIMWKLIEASAAREKFECINDVEGDMRGEYSIAEASDLSQYILPLMRVMARRVGFFFAHPIFTRVANRLLLRDALPLFVGPYLAPISLKRQIFCYYVHVLRNDK